MEDTWPNADGATRQVDPTPGTPTAGGAEVNQIIQMEELDAVSSVAVGLEVGE
jgi:hypothetical protein